LRENAAACEKVQVLTISKLFGEAIIRSYRGDSVTSLFI
jgi:ribose-phosphate pyrophosphokinase